MNTKSLFLIAMTFMVSGGLVAQKNKIPAEAALDHTRQFWVASESVEDDYLVKVYLPDSYFKNNRRRYPVIYMTDGDRYFGITSGLVFTQLFQNDFEVILVGIGYGSIAKNSDKRGRDFRSSRAKNPTVGCDAYLSFLENELLPRVESDFRIDASDRTIAGWSRGATLVLSALFKKAGLFKNYVSLSPQVNYPDWSMLELEKTYHGLNQDLPGKLYLSIGSNDRRFPNFPELEKNLTNHAYKQFEFRADILQGKVHDGVALAEGFGNALSYIFELEP